MSGVAGRIREGMVLLSGDVLLLFNSLQIDFPGRGAAAVEKFGNKKVLKLLDYAAGLDGLPKSDVLKFLLEDNCSIVIRPSGTEPKLKMYISVNAEDKEAAEKTEEEICRSAEEYLNEKPDLLKKH